MMLWLNEREDWLSVAKLFPTRRLAPAHASLQFQNFNSHQNPFFVAQGFWASNVIVPHLAPNSLIEEEVFPVLELSC